MASTSRTAAGAFSARTATSGAVPSSGRGTARTGTSGRTTQLARADPSVIELPAFTSRDASDLSVADYLGARGESPFAPGDRYRGDFATVEDPSPQPVVPRLTRRGAALARGLPDDGGPPPGEPRQAWMGPRSLSEAGLARDSDPDRNAASTAEASGPDGRPPIVRVRHPGGRRVLIVSLAAVAVIAVVSAVAVVLLFTSPWKATARSTHTDSEEEEEEEGQA